jgi:hypothetical protein
MEQYSDGGLHQFSDSINLAFKTYTKDFEDKLWLNLLFSVNGSDHFPVEERGRVNVLRKE